MSRQNWQEEAERLAGQVGRVICPGRREKLDRLATLVAEGEAASTAETGAAREAMSVALRRAETVLVPFLKMRGAPGDPARRGGRRCLDGDSG